jgi:hypothetical protein
MANYDEMRQDVLGNNTNQKWVVAPVNDAMTLEQMLANRDTLYIFNEFWVEKLGEQTGGVFSGDKRAMTNISAILDHQDNLIKDYDERIEALFPGMSAYYPERPQVCTYGLEAEPACKDAIKAQALETIEILKNLPPGSYIDPTTGEVVNVTDGEGKDYALPLLVFLGIIFTGKILFKKKRQAA